MIQAEPPVALPISALIAALAVALQPMAAGSAWAGPDQVVLIRHGHKDRPRPEKPIDYNLSETGLLQSLQLGRMIPACLQAGRPLHLGSYGFEAASGKNARSYQTLVPLAVATGANITVFPEADRDSEALGLQIRRQSRYDGGVLVLAWEHRHLPLLAAGLGWAGMPPVDDDDFDSLWVLRYGPDGGFSGVEVLSQRQLESRACYRSPAAQRDPLMRVVQRLINGAGPGR